MKESSDTFSKSMKEVGSLGKKMNIPGLDKVGKFAGPFNKLSGASGKLGGALKGLGGAMGAIDAIVQTWQTGWNLGKKLGEMMGLAKIFHNALYGKQAEADKKKHAKYNKDMQAITDKRTRRFSQWVMENKGVDDADKYMTAVKRKTELSKKLDKLKRKSGSGLEISKIKQEQTNVGNTIQYYENLEKISKAKNDPVELARLKKQNKGIRKILEKEELDKRFERYSFERTSAFEEGRKQRQQYYINSVGLTPQQALQKKSEYYSQQMQKSKEFEERARINFEDAKNKDIGPAMRNFGREGEQERARQMKIAAQQANVNGWIKDYKDLDEISKKEKSDQKITGYLDKIARNVVKIDQHTYGTKSNTEDMLRAMTNKESVTL
jgi:hypothetical protein